ncbi:conserved hypothetical protein [Allomeiothermus silvanus DSM 9946]|uniref:DUF2939 domain-containing protein n=1 Tax=Allomeiothermus silvanus (strain ATCC 700542 / DSM 9946 / NBRC 106475 / NCIMB 13440 / VI-R2) TaxID=526227 RepID=D7BDX8_ALLS1|nr:DUF2939 domain-containing protein [Allomeiothermus silvanus]ADH63129.1 conserved hypothetical protein [Allomeiothermus silvanus DSM 9946]
MNTESQEKSTPTPKKPLLFLAVLAGLLLLLAYAWFSPYLTLRGIQQSIQRNNPSALERYIDFPRVRESLRADLNRMLVEQASQDQTGFGALGLLFVAPLIDQLVSVLVTPEGLASIGTGQEPQKGDLGAVRDWRLKREGFSRALLHPKDNPNEGLLMERRGLGWKVVRLQVNTLPK